MPIRKIVWIACSVLAAIVAACVIIYRLLTTGQVQPLALLLLAAVISIMLPMIRANFFPSTRDCNAEFSFHSRRLDEYVRQQIVENLGQAAYRQICTPPATSNNGPQDYFSTLLSGQKALSNADLRFALLVALARHQEKAGDPQAAVESLTAAQKLRPQDFVTRFNLAHNHEWQGNRNEAHRVLRQIVDSPAGLSRAMIKLTRRRMAELDER